MEATQETGVDLRRSGYADRPDYRLDILARRNRVVVRTEGAVIADSLHPLLVDEQDHGLVFYLPRDDVRMDSLEPSETVTFCPFKGEASHWRVRGGDRDVAWSYEQPYPEVARLTGYVAFYQDRVSVEIGQAP
ncbi:MAG: hypothetical protein QOJ03_1801 [Frankiaceae bacterium]|jgi:uncharacterized protein (DUF427 family)|nr:hypothetical protein [Frankiaceae bacterium]